MFDWIRKALTIAIILLVFLAEKLVVEGEYGTKAALKSCGVSSLLQAVEAKRGDCVINYQQAAAMVVAIAGLLLAGGMYFLLGVARRAIRQRDSHGSG